MDTTKEDAINAPVTQNTCAVDQTINATTECVVATDFNMDSKGWLTDNYYGQVYVSNTSASCMLTIEASTSTYQMAMGNHFPITLYPGQFVKLYYYTKTGLAVHSGDSTMTVPFTLQPIFGFKDTSLRNNGYPWWQDNSALVVPITGTMKWTCDPTWSQGNIYISATITGQAVTGLISQATPHQRPSGNYFDDMYYAINPGQLLLTPATYYDQNGKQWILSAAGWVCDIAWAANEGAAYLNKAFLIIKIIAWFAQQAQAEEDAKRMLEERDRLYEEQNAKRKIGDVEDVKDV